jgi:hypothetical protein
MPLSSYTVSLHAYLLKQFVRFIYECISTLPISRSRVILVEEDSRFGNGLREVVAEPEASLRSGRRAPCVPRVVDIILASKTQAMDGNNARYCQRSQVNIYITYSTFAVWLATVLTLRSGYNCLRGFEPTISVRGEHRVYALTIIASV